MVPILAAIMKAMKPTILQGFSIASNVPGNPLFTLKKPVVCTGFKVCAAFGATLLSKWHQYRRTFHFNP
jgi:hypothetical protein